MVKNVVIVFIGVKGGFVLKYLFDLSDCEVWLVEG